MTESKFQSLVIKHLKSKNAYVINNIGTITAGIPDLTVCVGGVFISLELKVPGKYKATQLQIANLMKVKKAGGYAAVFTYSENWVKDLNKMIVRIMYAALGIDNMKYFYDEYPLPKLKKGVHLD